MRDWKKKVLRETGVSGALIGVAAGAATGAATGALLARSQGLDMKRGAIVGAIVGAAAGGTIGYHRGKQQGEKVVAKAMSRDTINSLLRGAKAYNQGLVNYNRELTTKISAARKEADPNTQKKRYKSLEMEARGMLGDADSRVKERKKAANNPQWDSNQRKQYANTISPLTTQRNALAKQVENLTRLRTEGVY
jgi:hypothetical protein